MPSNTEPRRASSKRPSRPNRLPWCAKNTWSCVCSHGFALWVFISYNTFIMSEVISFNEWAEASGWTKAEAADKIADLLYHPTEPLSMRGACGRLGLDSDS